MWLFALSVALQAITFANMLWPSVCTFSSSDLVTRVCLSDLLAYWQSDGRWRGHHMLCLQWTLRQKLQHKNGFTCFTNWRSIALVWSCLSYLPAWHQQLLMQAGGKREGLHKEKLSEDVSICMHLWATCTKKVSMKFHEHCRQCRLHFLLGRPGGIAYQVADAVKKLAGRGKFCPFVLTSQHRLDMIFKYVTY